MALQGLLRKTSIENIVAFEILRKEKYLISYLGEILQTRVLATVVTGPPPPTKPSGGKCQVSVFRTLKVQVYRFIYVCQCLCNTENSLYKIHKTIYISCNFLDFFNRIKLSSRWFSSST